MLFSIESSRKVHRSIPPRNLSCGKPVVGQVALKFARQVKEIFLHNSGKESVESVEEKKGNVEKRRDTVKGTS